MRSYAKQQKTMERFSKRYGHSAAHPEISVRHDAPEELRGVVVDIAYESSLSPKTVRSAVCRVLRRRTDPNNWSDFPNVDGEARDHVDSCEWYEVYDIIEALYDAAGRSGGYGRNAPAEIFEEQINDYFARRGIGWQLIDGEIQTRGDEAFEQVVADAKTQLATSGRVSAARELHEALRDLSRRPDPDVTGSIQHALAALECVARDVTGDPKATLGSIIKSYAGLIPPPLDIAVSKLWGYASEQGRHLREGREPAREEAALVVHTSAVIADYLSRKASF